MANNYPEHAPVLAAANYWAERCLLHDGSVFTEEKFWTMEVLEEFKVRFVENFLEDKRGFMEKLEEQLKGGTPQLCKFTSELMWVLYLFPGILMSAKKKSEQVKQIWGWSGETFPGDPLQPAAFNEWIGHPGTAFNTHRWREVGYLWRVVWSFKKLGLELRQSLLADPWKFAEWLDRIEDSTQRLMRNILLHLIFPEEFERIASKNHKLRIREAFASKLDGTDSARPEYLAGIASCDWEVLRIRKKLESESTGIPVDFYEEPYKEVWQGAQVPESGEGTVKEDPVPYGKRHWVIAPGASARLWEECLEKGIISVGWDEIGDLTQYANKDEIRDALVEQFGDNGSYMNNSLALWDFANSVKVGDVVYAKQGTARVLGWGIVKSDYEFDTLRIEHQHVRKVEWKNTREVALPEPSRIPLKTLTNVDGHPKFLEFVESFYEEDEGGTVEIDPTLRQYWWLNASPKVWDFKELPVGGTQDYTAINAKGNKRQKYKYFEQVRPGDIVIGYLTTPVKQIVSICEITKGMKETKGVGFEFKKTEDLAKPISWEELQTMPQLKDCEPVMNNQGSLFKVTTEEYEFLRSLFDEREEVSPIPPYSRDQALEDLFLSGDKFDRILSLLKRKKNIILQGPPGVGKTFVARRLAFALMKQKDEGRAPMIQFHQSYAYEDFIQGYRPDGKGGFFLKNGTFHTLCRRAERDLGRDYFLVIDEINRGNLSKIFGELMMLMEADKRGPDYALQLAYAESIEETFHIPENLHLIGTMNTADRSLALVDYALRRRFAFITLEPEFSSAKFREQLEKRGADGDLIDRIVKRMNALNQLIHDDSHNLGWGYRIGHSFFCPNGTLPDEEWYEQVIEFEIAPLLREYWVDDESKAEAELEKLLS